MLGGREKSKMGEDQGKGGKGRSIRLFRNIGSFEKWDKRGAKEEIRKRRRRLKESKKKGTFGWRGGKFFKPSNRVEEKKWNKREKLPCEPVTFQESERKQGRKKGQVNGRTQTSKTKGPPGKGGEQRKPNTVTSASLSTSKSRNSWFENMGKGEKRYLLLG